MLEGVVPLSAGFSRALSARRGTAGPVALRMNFQTVFKQFAERVALIDGERQFTYANIDRLRQPGAESTSSFGLKPLDRVVPTLPNVAEFVLLYFALQKDRRDPDRGLVRTAMPNQPVRKASPALRHASSPEPPGRF